MVVATGGGKEAGTRPRGGVRAGPRLGAGSRLRFGTVVAERRRALASFTGGLCGGRCGGGAFPGRPGCAPLGFQSRTPAGAQASIAAMNYARFLTATSAAREPSAIRVLSESGAEP